VHSVCFTVYRNGNFHGFGLEYSPVKLLKCMNHHRQQIHRHRANLKVPQKKAPKRRVRFSEYLSLLRA